jgi:hypothetical protein
MLADTWSKEFPGAIVVCDAEGIILEINDKAAADYAKEGGYGIIGTNMFDCHPEPARSKLKVIMDARQTNIYTTERKGVWKLIYQCPWTRDGVYAGFVELAMRIPSEMPHFIRG